MSVATPQAITAGTWQIDTVHSHVGFAVKHMVVSTFRGRFEDYRGSLTVGDEGAGAGGLKLEGSVDVDSIVVKDHTHRVTARGSITGPHTDIAGNDKIGAELEAVIDRREYGLEWNAPLPKGGFALDNDVQLQVSLELVREP